MKKVGVVSCYFQHNYGSMLQAYATQMALDKLNVQNKTINIEGFNHEIKRAKILYFIKASLTTDILLSKFGMASNVLHKKFKYTEYSRLTKIRDAKFDDFSKKNIRLDEKYNSKKELAERCAVLYTDILVGSDQLWLPANIIADFYTLNFVPKNINKIAYATSFGMSKLPKNIEKNARNFLYKIDSIGVREKSGQQIIKQLIHRDVEIVCDPTLLFSGNEWLEIQEINAILDEKYIFCYFLGNNKLHREYARKLKDKTGYKIVALLHLDHYVKYDERYADIKPYDVGPSEFLNYIRNAQYICTDSFHCSIFATLYKKEFFTFYRYTNKTAQSTNSRIDNLFEQIGIKDRILKGDENVETCIGIVTDFDEVEQNLQQIREKSYNYLIKALRGKNI